MLFGYASFQVGLLLSKPRALMREMTVVGFMPSRAAAPVGPKTFPPVCASATFRFSRSRRLSSPLVRTAGVSAGAASTAGGPEPVELQRPTLGEDDGALDGVLQFAHAWKEVNPGDMVNIAPDAIHGFRNESYRDVKLLLTCEAGLGRFFEEAGTPLTENQSARANISAEEIQRVLQIAKKHGQRFPAPA